MFCRGIAFLFIMSHLLFSQSAPVILAPHWTPAALRQVTATASPTTAETRVTSALLVTMLTQAAHVSHQALYGRLTFMTGFFKVNKVINFVWELTSF